MALKNYLARLTFSIYLCAIMDSGVACPSVCSCSASGVNCYGKNLKVVPYDLPKDATFIDLQTNDIEAVHDEFHNMTKVQEIHLRFNKISYLSKGAFRDLPSLTQVNLGSNLLATLTPGIFANLPKLRVLDLTQNELTNLDGAFDELAGLSKLVLTRNKLESLTSEALKPLKSLIYFMADENKISSVEDTAFDNLQELAFVQLSKNPLGNMDGRLTHNEHLSYLDLSQCNLEKVPAGLPWATRYLQLSKNRIGKISRDTFRPTRYLGIIILDENNITDIDPGAFAIIPHLQQLWLNGNKLTAFPSPIPNSVGTVSAERNEIAEISVTDFPENSNMTLLSLRGNKLRDISPFTFSNLKEMKSLYLGGNQIAELKDKSFFGMRLLTALELDRNPVTHIDTRFAAGLTNLKTMDLSYIEDTEPLMKGNFFRDIPHLQTLKMRSTPTLAKNILSSAETLTSFYNLKEFDLRDNHLQSLEMDLPRFFPSLQSIELARNAWVCDTQLLWLHDWIRRRPEIFQDAEEVECAMPMHLAGAAIRDLPLDAFRWTTTTTTTTIPTTTEILETDDGSGETTEIFASTTSDASKDSSKSATAKGEKETTVTPTTEDNSSDFISELTEEGFLTTKSYPTAKEENTKETPTEGITIIDFATDTTIEDDDAREVTTLTSFQPTKEASSKTSPNTNDGQKSTAVPQNSSPEYKPTETTPIATTTSKAETSVQSSGVLAESTTTAVLTTKTTTASNAQPTGKDDKTSSQENINDSTQATDDQNDETTNGSEIQSSPTTTTSKESETTTTTPQTITTPTTSTESTPTPFIDHELDIDITHSPNDEDDENYENSDNNDSGYPRVGGSHNRMPSFAETSSGTRTIIIATSVSIMALIAVLITIAMVRRHRKKIKRAYVRAFDHRVEAADTTFVLSDQDDPDTLPDSRTSTLRSTQRSRSGSRSNSEGRGDRSMDTFIWEESP